MSPPITLADVGRAYRVYRALKPDSEPGRRAWAEFQRLAFGWAEGHAQSEKITLNLFGEPHTVHLRRDGPEWAIGGAGVPVVDVTGEGRQA